MATGQIRPAGDLAALQKAWYGDDVVTVSCPAGTTLDGLPWNDRFGCYDPALYTLAGGSVVVRGVEVATLSQFTVLGIIEAIE